MTTPPPYEPKCPSYLNVLWGSAYYPYHCVIPAGHTGNHRSGEHLYEWENSADRSSAPSAPTQPEE